MRKTHTFAAVLTLALAGLASFGPVAGAAGQKSLTLRHTRLGEILVAPNGFTLYEFARDSARTDNCQKIRGCIAFWPPLVSSSGAPTAGPGVDTHLLGTIRLANGTRQVTYAGHPLYMYAGDSGPGQTGYVGVNASGGFWYAINARGAAVR
jgi:predicted lipoprotein with Yx(FWY)xxD motif